MPLASWMLSLEDFTSSGLGDSVAAIASLDVDVASFAGDARGLCHVLRCQRRRLVDALSVKSTGFACDRRELKHPAIAVCGYRRFKIDGPARAPASIRVINNFGALNEMPGLRRADALGASRDDFDDAGHVVMPLVPQLATIFTVADFVQTAIPVVVGENDFLIREILN